MDDIHHIIDSVIQGCSQGGVEVSEVLAAFVARTVVETNASTFSLDRNATESQTQEVILQSIEKLLEKDNPSLEMIKMQVDYDSTYLTEENEAQRKLKSRNKMISGHKMAIVDVEMGDASDYEALTTLYRKIFKFLLEFAPNSKPSDRAVEREIAAALESVFPRVGLKAFIQLNYEDKVTQLLELARIILGIRLFNRDEGRGGAGIDDMDKDANILAHVLSQDIDREVDFFVDACAKYQKAIVKAHVSKRKRDHERAEAEEEKQQRMKDNEHKPAAATDSAAGGPGGTSGAQTGGSHPLQVTEVSDDMVERWSQELSNRRQYLGFLRTLQDEAKFLLEKISTICNNIRLELNNVRSLVTHKSAIPKEIVYPRFDALGSLWLQLFEEVLTMIARSNTFQALCKYRLSFNPTLTEKFFLDTAGPTSNMSLAAELEAVDNKTATTESGAAAPPSSNANAGAQTGAAVEAPSTQPSSSSGTPAEGTENVAAQSSTEGLHSPATAATAAIAAATGTSTSERGSSTPHNQNEATTDAATTTASPAAAGGDAVSDAPVSTGSNTEAADAAGEGGSTAMPAVASQTSADPFVPTATADAESSPPAAAGEVPGSVALDAVADSDAVNKSTMSPSGSVTTAADLEQNAATASVSSSQQQQPQLQGQQTQESPAAGTAAETSPAVQSPVSSPTGPATAATAAADSATTAPAAAPVGTVINVDDTSNPYGLEEVSAAGARLLSVHNTPDFMLLPLELQGYCPWTIVQARGLLIPGKPSLGIVRYDNMYYVFDHPLSIKAFMQNPNKFLSAIRERALRHPEFINLLRLHKWFPTASIAKLLKIHEMETNNKTGQPLTKDASTGTPTHFQDSYIDIHYHWNEWELRRRALKMVNLKNCATTSQQTDASHFKRDNETQVYPHRIKGTQTKREKGTNPPTVTTYVAGLRGKQNMSVQRRSAEAQYDAAGVELYNPSGGGSHSNNQIVDHDVDTAFSLQYPHSGVVTLTLDDAFSAPENIKVDPVKGGDRRT